MPWPIYIQFMPVQTHTYSFWFNALTFVGIFLNMFSCALSAKSQFYWVIMPFVVKCVWNAATALKENTYVWWNNGLRLYAHQDFEQWGEKAGVEGPPSSSSPLVLKTKRGLKINLPVFFPSGAVRLASALRLCAGMHISCIVSFEYIVKSPSMISFLFLVYPLLLLYVFEFKYMQYHPNGSQRVSRLSFTWFIYFSWCLYLRCVRPPTRWSVWHKGRTALFAPESNDLPIQPV